METVGTDFGLIKRSTYLSSYQGTGLSFTMNWNTVSPDICDILREP